MKIEFNAKFNDDAEIIAALKKNGLAIYPRRKSRPKINTCMAKNGAIVAHSLAMSRMETRTVGRNKKHCFIRKKESLELS